MGTIDSAAQVQRALLEVARGLPKELLRLIGYARGAYALGYVDDVRDPIEVVRPDLAKDGLGDLDEAQVRARQQLERLRTGPA